MTSLVMNGVILVVLQGMLSYPVIHQHYWMTYSGLRLRAALTSLVLQKVILFFSYTMGVFYYTATICAYDTVVWKAPVTHTHPRVFLI